MQRAEEALTRKFKTERSEAKRSRTDGLNEVRLNRSVRQDTMRRHALVKSAPALKKPAAQLQGEPYSRRRMARITLEIVYEVAAHGSSQKKSIQPEG